LFLSYHALIFCEKVLVLSGLMFLQRKRMSMTRITFKFDSYFVPLYCINLVSCWDSTSFSYLTLLAKPTNLLQGTRYTVDSSVIRVIGLWSLDEGSPTDLNRAMNHTIRDILTSFFSLIGPSRISQNRENKDDWTYAKVPNLGSSSKFKDEKLQNCSHDLYL